jgi:3-deoxy-D-manno-octulosonic-acid transferase
VAMGAHAEAVRVGGNLKYDVRAPKESRVAELIKEAAGGRPIVVAGSTVGEDPPEDSPLIRWQQATQADTRPLLVLAPRRAEEFPIIYSMAIEYPTLLATEMLQGKDASQGYSTQLRENERALVEIIVIDTIGDLAAVYGVADVAFVGGSLVKRGGHNPLEPAQFGVPVVIGPSYENFRDIVSKMRKADAIRIIGDGGASAAAALHANSVKDPKLYDGLSLALAELLAHRDEAKAMGKRGQQVFEAQQGATKRAVEAIVSLIQGAKA